MKTQSEIKPIMHRKKSSAAALALILVFAASFLTGCAQASDDTANTANIANSANEGETITEQPLDSAPEYAEKIFGTDIITLEILSDEEDWQTMLDNATAEAYIKADVIVNGTTFKDVGIRPKGNSSLKQVASSDSDRYSFRIKFDKYVDGQTCFGLDQLVVNNMMGDNTYMKEYISYDLMKTIGVDAPYFGFTDISVNGRPWGLYLAVELYNDSYETRVYGDTSGTLYNVKMSMGQDQMPVEGRGPMVNDPAMDERPSAGSGASESVPPAKTPPDSTASGLDQAPGGFPANAPGGFPGGKGGNMGAKNGGSLAYTDDDPESYSDIFDNVVGEEDTAANQRVITALKALSTGTDLETYLDTDAILRYLAAHTIVVNLDSYSSTMAQNYYLYERGGEIAILPWDYNLAWGGFQSGDASAVINFPIDTPVSGVAMTDRPLLNQLLSNQDYLAQYHDHLNTLIQNYFADGHFTTKIQALNTLIADYVKKDATAFCTYEEYQTAVEAFTDLGTLRAESIQGQLSGDIPSSSDGQKADPSSLISADDLNLQDLGSMMGDRKN
ncbi:CotH kinase family protein [Acidaminobacter sp.]|uniref:CotH kinase family protein n=1 Tax=Acidaminobacter sp. TaxID=1872102 RepID=UPI00256A01DB|nr:CotH kinase family protein [Acidaminobacter sp.]MDK9711159.1 CotH kinase family protein [Acidaminobacter sp.]